MGITFGILTQGSAFWHGSETLNGASADVVINDLFAYVAYQAAVENLLPKESSIIHELSPRPLELIEKVSLTQILECSS